MNPHELSRRLEEVLVDAVNDVGVDLNKAVCAIIIYLIMYTRPTTSPNKTPTPENNNNR